MINRKAIYLLGLLFVILVIAPSCQGPKSLNGIPSEGQPKTQAVPEAVLPFVSQGLAGNYYYGSGAGVNSNLNLSEHGIFTLNNKDGTKISEENQGIYKVEDGFLILSPQKPISFPDVTPTMLIPVKWGERLYLVPDERILGFCMDIKQGKEPRKEAQGLFYLRENDWEKPVIGVPDFPDKYKNLRSLFE
jgi:hypothetical protein